jgi:hypothetical protein
MIYRNWWSNLKIFDFDLIKTSFIWARRRRKYIFLDSMSKWIFVPCHREQQDASRSTETLKTHRRSMQQKQRDPALAGTCKLKMAGLPLCLTRAGWANPFAASSRTAACIWLSPPGQWPISRWPRGNWGGSLRYVAKSVLQRPGRLLP